MGESIFPLITKHFNIFPEGEGNLLKEKWHVTLNGDDKTNIGSLCFEDGIFNGEVKMNVELDSAYEKSKYIQEIFYSMARFIFQFHEITEVSTECRHENDNRVRGLEKAGYIRRETKDGSDFYSIRKQKTAWTGFYVFIGFIAGLLIGIVVSNLWMGTVAGIVIGAIMGYLMDKKQ